MFFIIKNLKFQLKGDDYSNGANSEIFCNKFRYEGMLNMKNKCRIEIKRLACLLTVMLLMLSLLAGCTVDESKSRYELDVVNHTSDFYINDFAGIFSEEQKKVYHSDA